MTFRRSVLRVPTVEIRRGVSLCTESFGTPSDPTVLLIAGLGAQLLSWEDGLCNELVARGLHVVRFDNRDCGLSTKFDGIEVDLDAVIAAATAGEIDAARRLVPYTLHDMADDTAALIDAMGTGPVHVVGASMGGMIAQLVAITHSDVVLSLTSMMSSTGEAHVGQSAPEAAAALLAPPATTREAYVEAALRNRHVWGSRRYIDREAVAESAGRSFDRSHNPQGMRRQLAALLATGSLADGLRTLDLPTLVIHGRDDTLITPSGGERTAELVAGARLVMVDDMGHDRPAALWPLLCDLIADHVLSVDDAAI